MRNGRILLIDDNQQKRSLLAANLKGHGYIVIEVEGGRSAFDKLKQETVDLVILDLTLEVEDFQILAHIKGSNKLKHVPVIVVSDAADTASVVRAIEMGAADYLTRPVDENLLQARVNASLANKRLHDLEQETRRELHTQKALFQQLLFVAQIVSQSLSLEDTLENILRVSVSLAKAARGSLYLVNPSQQVTSYIYSAQKDELFTGSPTTIDRIMKSGLSGWVFQSQQPVILKDTRQDERWLAIGHEGSESRSVLAVPVSYQRDVLGVLTLVHPQPDYFHAEALGLLQAAADQMAMTLYNARLYTALQSTLARTEALYHVSQATNQIESSSELLQTVVDSIAAALPANRVILLLFDPDMAQLTEFVKGGKGLDDIPLIGFAELMGGLSGWVLQEKQPALSPKGQPDPRESEEAQQRRRETNCGSIIVVPLQYRDQVWGTITAVNNPDEADFTDADVNLMMAMASQVTVAIENARLYAAEKERVRELQAYVEELDMFSGAVAHDLKSPLTSIIGFSELLQEVVQGELPLLYIERIRSTGDKMDSLINDLLLLSKVRQSAVPIAPVDLRKIAAEAIRRLEYEIEQSQPVITWVGESWPPALGYSGWLEEVWVNYISNAVKYGGQPPRVELGADQPREGQVRYWIQDNGGGLSVEDQAKLFSRFERLDQITITGHGLGLAIVKRIVEKLGGQVGVESETGKGSLFYFILPAG